MPSGKYAEVGGNRQNPKCLNKIQSILYADKSEKNNTQEEDKQCCDS